MLPDARPRAVGRALRATMSAPPQKWSPRAVEQDDPHRFVAAGGVDGVDQRRRIIASSRALRLSGRSSVRRSTPSSSATTRPSTARTSASSVEPLADRVERALEVGGAAGRVGQADRRRARGWAAGSWRGPGVVTSPRWFTHSSSRSTAGRSPSARYLRVDRAPQPLRVADVVEQAELAVELPQPGVVAHPVGAEVDEPRLAHAAVVERGRVARRAGRTPGPSAPAASRRGRSSSSRWKKRGMRWRLLARQPQRLHAVEAHAHADVPADHVGDGERALHHRADLVALGDVLPPAGLGAARRLARRTAPRSRRSRRRCTASSSTSSYFLRSRAFVALGADHQPVLRRQERCRRRRGTPAPSTRAPPARRTRSACRARRRARCGGTRGRRGRSGAHHSRALRGVEGVHAAQRIALHQRRVLVGRPR